MLNEIQPGTPPKLDPERQKKAREYARTSRRIAFAGMGLEGLYALLWLVLGWSAALRTSLLGFTSHPWLLVPLFAAVYAGIAGVIGMPLSYYTGYVLPHRYGLSNQTLRGWIVDQIKGFLVSAPLGLLLLEIIYVVLRAYPDTWWLWAAGILLVFNVLLANLAPVLILPLFNKYVPLGEEHNDLEERLLRLAEKANTRVRGVYKFDMSRRTKTANAALTGLGSSRRILLGDTLINEFSADEIETVLAHELGHHVHKDIPLNLSVSTLVTLAGLYLCSLVLNWGILQFGFENIGDIAALPLFVLVIGLYGLVTLPFSNAFTRWQERRADRYALETTQKPAAFISAMTRLANQNLSDVDPEPWVETLLHSHPALNKRIAMAEAFKQNH